VYPVTAEKSPYRDIATFWKQPTTQSVGQ